MFKKIFIKLCTEKGESPSSVCNKIGITPAAFSQWTDDTIPRKVTQQKAAEYFGVSVDYLLGKQEKLAAEIDELNEYLEELKNRSELRMLFSTAKGATKEDVERAVAIIEALKKSEDG